MRQTYVLSNPKSEMDLKCLLARQANDDRERMSMRDFEASRNNLRSTDRIQSGMAK